MKRKLLLLALAMLLPSVAWGLTGIKIKTMTYELLSVPVSAAQYPDSLVENANRFASFDIAFWTQGLQRTIKVTTAANQWRYLVADSGDFKVLTVYKPVSTTAGARMQGYAEVEEDKFNMVTPSGAPVFSQARTGDSLWIRVQPTPTAVESLFVQTAYFPVSYVTTDSADANENPLPAPFSKWVAYLSALRLLQREAPYRNDVIAQIYTEFQQSIALFRPDLVERVNQLYVLPQYIKETESKPK